MVGKNLSHYKILEELGRGGMGVVYKAEDTKLDRTVAIKVLPSAALASEDDRSRFYREAKAAAALTHPNIGIVFAVDEAVAEGAPDGTEANPFIVMEFIDGETIEDLIKAGPLSLNEAVRITTEVASGLKMAHENDIVHRDIKTANVMLAKDGGAKVLDFGLAQTAQSTKITRLGSTLGTAAYMSPEQARGEVVDLRSDLWSLGVVLYEMIAGRPPFSTEYEQAALYSILNEDPEPLTSLRTGVPMELERITNKLLSKDRELRYQSATDLIVDLKTVELSKTGMSRQSVPANSSVNSQPETTTTKTKISTWAWVVLPVVLLAGLWIGSSMLGGQSQELDNYPDVVSTILLDEGRVPKSVSISPDGRLLAYSDVPDGVVWIRDLSSGEERMVEASSGIIEVEFSPDGEWLLLDSQTAIFRAPVSGGSAVHLHTVQTNAPHSNWIDNNSFLYDDLFSIFRYSMTDGTSTVVATADTLNDEQRLLWGNLSPSGDLMFTVIVMLDPMPTELAVYSYPEGERLYQEVWNGSSPGLTETGHLVGVAGTDLMVRAFDTENIRFAGPPILLAESVSETSWDISNWGQLVHAPITSFQFGAGIVVSKSTRISRGSSEEATELLDVPVERYSDFEVSPDGKKLAYEVVGEDGIETNIWILDLDTGIREQLTRNFTGTNPSWLPGSDSLVIVGGGRAFLGTRLEVISVDGSGRRRLVYDGTGERGIVYPDWSAATGLISVSLLERTAGWTIVFVDSKTGQEVSKITDIENANTMQSAFSPNGKYLAIEEGQEVTVRGTKEGGGEWNISQGLGRNPKWASSGDAIFFTRDGSIYKVAVDSGEQFRRLGEPELVLNSGVPLLFYDQIPGTDEFVYVTPENVDEENDQIAVTLMSNAFATFKRLAPIDN